MGWISGLNQPTFGIWDMEQRVALDVHDIVDFARFQNCHNGGTNKIQF